MRKELKFILIVFLLSIFSLNVHAAKRYWVGGTSNSWKNRANWSTTSGTGSNATIPGSSDTAFFDAAGTRHRCNIDSTVNIKRLSMTGDTLSQGANAITIGSTGAGLSGGVFLGGSSSITVSGTFTISGNAFTSTSGIFSTSANFTVSGSGTFTHNSGKMKFTATNTITGSITMFRLEFAPSANSTVYTIASGTTLTVNDSLIISGVFTESINTGAIAAKGNIAIPNSSNNPGGSATLTINGTGTQSMIGYTATGRGKLPNVVINKSSSDTLKLVNIISLSGNWTYTAGVIDAGSSTVYFAGTLTVSGSHTLFNVGFSGGAARIYTINSGTTLTVNGTLTTNQGSSITINTGTINAKGDIKISNTSTASGGTATLNINGTGNQLFTGNSAAGNGALCKVTINKSSGTLTLDSIISIANNWTWTTGTIAYGTSTVVFYDNSMTISGTDSLYNVTFYSSTGNYNYAIASGNTLTVKGTLTLDGTSGIALNTGTINAKGNIRILNNYNASGGNGLIVIKGSGTQTLTGGSTSPARLPSVTINKSSTDTLKLVSWIPVLGNWTYTAGILDAGTSLVQFITSKTISGTQTLHDVGLGGNATFTISSGSTLTTTGTLTFINNVGPITVNTGTINVKGDISLPNVYTGGGGSASIVINGTSDQTITGNSTDGASALPNVTINKSTGKLFLINTVSVAKNWTWTSGTVDAGTSTVYFITTKTIKGSHSLFNVTFDGSAASTYTIATGTTFTVKGILLINGSNIVKLDSGTVNAQGNITVTNTATGATGNTSLVINGTGIQTITGSGTAGQGRLPAITISKSFGETDFASIISIYGGLTYTLASKIDAYTNLSTVDLYGNFNLDAQGSSLTMSFYNLTIAGNTTTLTGNLSVLNNLTINSSTTLSAGSNGVTVGGNWVDNGTWTYATSSVTFNGSGYNTIAKSSGTETFYDLGFNRTTKSHKLNNPVTVNHTLTLTKGHVKTDATNYLLLIDNATLTGGGDDAYVHGPVRKTGNDAFTFPLGDTSLVDTAYHPLTISAPSSSSDQFEAAYYATASSHSGGTLEDTLETVSNCEYWTCERKVGSSNVVVSLGWNTNSCLATGTEEMTIAEWDGSQWITVPSAVTVYGGSTGTMGTTGAISIIGTPVHIVIGSRKLLTQFVPSRPQLDGFTTRSYGKKLYVIYNEKYKSGNLNYIIYDMNHSPISTSTSPVAKQYGQNWLRINLAPIPGLVINKYYVLEIQNDKGQKEYVRFCLK